MTDLEVQLVEKVARAIADEVGDGFDRAHKNKAHWVETRGEIGGRFRDVNEPYQCDYLWVAKEVIPLIQQQVLRDMLEPSEAMLKASWKARIGMVGREKGERMMDFKRRAHRHKTKSRFQEMVHAYAKEQGIEL